MAKHDIRLRCARRWLALTGLLGLALGSGGVQANILNEECIANILNRTTQVNEDGTFAIPNVPVPLGAFRVRVVCDREDGTTDLGQSPFVQGVPNGITDFGEITFDATDPIPVDLTMTTQGGVTLLTQSANGVQIQTTGLLEDGTPIDVTPGDTGTFYLSSNALIATVDDDGFVIAQSSGTFLVTAMHEGVIATILLMAEFDVDTDGDGIPDDFEELNTVNTGGANLARQPGVTATASSSSSSPPTRAVDGDLFTSWFTAVGDAANRRSAPFIEVTLPEDGNIAQVRLLGNRQSPNGFDIFAGVVQAFDADGNEVFNSGVVMLPAPDRDLAVPLDIDNIRRVRFTSTADESNTPGLSEIQLISRPGGPGLDPANGDDGALDFDLDGLTNFEEFQAGTSIFLNDTDGDGITDGAELALGSSPLLPDTDGDMIQDGSEVNPSGDPDGDGLPNIADADSDNDGLPDGVERKIGTDPFRVDSNFNGIPDGSEDADNDGLINGEEVLENTDPANPDTDGDGLADGEEVVPGVDGFVTDPLRADTDGDTMLDGYESRFGLDPTDPGDVNNDPDMDGKTNGQEALEGTDPFNNDIVSPAVAEIMPRSAALDVPVNSVVIVRATEQLLGTSVSDGVITLSFDNGSGPVPIPGDVRLSGDLLSLTFSPDEQLPSETTISVDVQDVRDLAGNVIVPFASVFDTGEFIDDQPPSFVRTNIPFSSTDIPVNSLVTVEYDERMDPGSFTPGTFRVRNNVTFEDVPGMIQVDPAGRRSSFIAAGNFPPLTGFSVFVNGVTDVAGNQASFVSFSFTTAFSPDNDRLVFLGGSPANGLTNVPVNGVVVVDFDEPVDLVSLLAGMSVRVGGDPVPGSVALSLGNRRATFTSADALAANATHVVTLTSTITDIVGNPLDNSTSFNFTTTDVGDTVRPRLLDAEPTNASLDVPTNAVFGVIFDDVINQLTFNQGLILERVQNGAPVPATITPLPNASGATVTPLAPLDTFTRYRLRSTSDIRDLANNPYTGSTQATLITTGSGPLAGTNVIGDNIAGTPVAANVAIVIALSGPISNVNLPPNGLAVTLGGAAVPGAVVLNGTRDALVFTPDQPLAGGSYQVAVQGLVDVAGNTVTAFMKNFAVGLPDNNLSLSPGVVATASTVFNGFPTSRSIDGDLGTSWFTASGDAFNRGTMPFFQIELPGDATLTELRMFGNRESANGFDFFAGTFQVLASDMSVLFDSGEVQLPATINDIDRDVIVPLGSVANARFVRFDATADEGRDPGFAELQVIGVFNDAALNAVAVTDNVRPRVAQFVPTNGTTGVPAAVSPQIIFDAPIDPLTVPGRIGVRRDAGNVNLAANVSLGAFGRTVTIDPLQDLQAGIQYELFVDAGGNGVLDLAGNVMIGTTTSRFIIDEGAALDTTPPSIVAVDPVVGTRIGVRGRFRVEFSESMDPAFVNTVHFQLFDGSDLLSTSVSRSLDNRVVTLSAFTDLPIGGNVSLAISGAVQDVAGNPLGAGFQQTYDVIDDIDLDRPTVSAQRPRNFANNVAEGLNSAVLFVSEPVDPATVAGSMFLIEDGQLVSGSTTVDATGRVVTFTADAPFAKGAIVQVFLRDSVTDTSGNPLFDFQGRFTMEPDDDAVGFFATQHSVSELLFGTHPTNVLPMVRFTKDVDPASVVPSAFGLFESATSTPVPFDVEVAGTDRVRLVPLSPLAPATSYFYTLTMGENGVAAADGSLLQFQNSAGFTTAAGPDNESPVLDAVSPRAGAVDIPANGVLRIVTSERVNSLTVGDALSITDQNGGLLTCTVSVDSLNQTITIVPHTPFAVGADVTVSLAGVEDHAGNQLMDSYGFVANGAVDTVRPTIVATPSSSATDIPVNTVFELIADEPLDAVLARLPVLRDSFTGQQIPTGVSSLPDRVTLAPEVALVAARDYQIDNISQLEDYAGNRVTGNTFVSFETGVVADTANPMLVAVDPMDGAVSVPTNARITVLVDEPIQAGVIGGVQLSVAGVVLPTTTTLTDGNRRLTLKPSALLAPDTAHDVTIAGLLDLAGNALPTTTVSFVSGEGPDITRPRVDAFDPVNGLTDVATNATPMLRFDSLPNRALINESTVTLRVRSPNGFSLLPVPATVTISDDGLIATLMPDAPLQPGSEFFIQVLSITDTAGNPLLGSTSSGFFTGVGPDNLAPSVVAQSVADGAVVAPNAVVSVLLDEPIKLTLLEANTITVRAGGQEVAGTTTLSTDRRRLEFVPPDPLAAGQYDVTLNRLTDNAGNTIGPLALGSFTVAGEVDTTRPRVASFLPVNGTTGVASQPLIQVTFEEPMDSTMIDGVVMLRALDPVDGLAQMVTLSADGMTATIVPEAPLEAGRRYQILTSGSRDLAGNTLTATNNASFTVDPAGVMDTAPPLLLNVLPADGAVNQGTRTRVVLRFNESLKGSTVNANTIEVLDSTGANVSVSYALTMGGKEVVITPSRWTAGSTISVLITAGVQDINGNPFGGAIRSFTVVPLGDVSLPSLSAQRPSNFASNVSQDANLALIFSEPMQFIGAPAGVLVRTGDGVDVPGTVSLFGDGQGLLFMPDAPWPAGGVVEVRILDNILADLSGNLLPAYQGRFTVINPAADIFFGIERSSINDPGDRTLDVQPVFRLTKPVDLATVDADDVVVRLDEFQQGEFCDVEVDSFDNPSCGPTSCPGLEECPSCPLGLDDPNMFCFEDSEEPPTEEEPGFLFCECFVDPADAEVAAVLSALDDRTLRIVPSENLEPFSEYSVDINGTVTSADGDTLFLFQRLFTGDQVDLDGAPGVLAISPGNGATEVPLNAEIRLLFDETMASPTLNENTLLIDDGTGEFLACTITFPFSANRTQMVITPNGLLKPNTVYTVALDGALDQVGNPLPLSNFSFTTGATLDTEAPVSVVTPERFSVGVPTNASVTIGFTEPVAATSAANFLLRNRTNFGTILHTGTLSADGMQITLTPDQPLEPLTFYDGFATGDGVRDVTGNFVSIQSFSFTTGLGPETDNPTVEAASPSNGTTGVPLNAKVSVLLSETPAAGDLNKVQLLQGGLVVPTTAMLDNFRRVFVTPQTSLMPDTTYVIRASGITDIVGNAMVGTFESTFTTGGVVIDSTRPTLVSADPANGSVDVPVDAVMSATFSEAIDPTVALTGIGFFLDRSADATVVDGTVSISADALTLTFTPAAPLDPGTSYRIRATSALRDPAGNSYSSTSVPAQFTTAP